MGDEERSPAVQSAIASPMDTAFYVPDGAGFAATPLTRGPWDVRFQHGGPPSALVCGALARWGTDSERWFLSRLTIELLRPVPLGHVGPWR